MSPLVLMTDPLVPDETIVAQVAVQLAAGRLAVVPTETVYGLAAGLDRPEAVRSLGAAKGRPDGKPLQVLVPDEATARSLAGAWGVAAERLAAGAWPGPLTLVVPAAAGVWRDLVAADGTIGLRCPDHPALRAVMRHTGPLAASSANRAGEPPAVTAAEALAALGGAVAVVLDTGPALGGVASTVVRVAGGAWEVLREGALSRAAVQALVGGQPEEPADG